MHDARIRVYQLPEKLTNGFCFAGGTSIAFLNVDWFHAPDAILSIIQPEEDKKRVAELLETNTRYLLRARKSEELLQALIDKSMGHIHTRHLTDAQEHLKDPWA